MSKYPALNPSKNLKQRKNLIDYDYLGKLSEEELQWLNDFTEEYTNSGFKNGERKKNDVLSEKDKTEAYRRNYLRQNDIQNLLEIHPWLSTEDMEVIRNRNVLTEDQLVAIIDYRLGKDRPRRTRKRRNEG